MTARIVEPAYAGNVESVTRLVVERVREASNRAGVDVLVFFGEATISLPKQHGVGGRAQQLALELAKAMQGEPVCGLVAGTDGVDGNSKAAGAFFSGDTWSAVTALHPDQALLDHDVGTLMLAAGLSFETGPTGINHADLVVISLR